MKYGLQQQKNAALSGHWPLYRYDPRRAADGQPSLVLDSKAPSIPLEEYMYAETRYRMLTQTNPDEARRLLALAQEDVRARWERYEQLADHWLAGDTLMPDLSTRYLGMRLPNPFVPSALPLSRGLDTIRRMEDAGAAVVVLHSLFEEQINFESRVLDEYLSSGADTRSSSTCTSCRATHVSPARRSRKQPSTWIHSKWCLGRSSVAPVRARPCACRCAGLPSCATN